LLVLPDAILLAEDLVGVRFLEGHPARRKEAILGE
jgi:hypothetical protein